VSIDKLNLHFNEYFPLNAKERNELGVLFTQNSIKRRQYILQQGEVCRHFTFVISGCLRMYAIDKNGKEHNIQFIAENDWAMDLSSFYAEKASRLSIEAVEPTTFLQIKHDDVLYLYTEYHKFDHNFRVIIEQKYIESQNRVLQNISSSAEERYECFLKQYPHLANRLPLTQIASYLGITPEFLSAIRKNIVSKG
jgi:CRP-like cAMP-binding protein